MDTVLYSIGLRRFIHFFEATDASHKLFIGNSLLRTSLIIMALSLYRYFNKRDGAYLIIAITNLIFMVFIKINMP